MALRPTAAALGTSARMLLYHFGSKEQMLVEALKSIQERREDAGLAAIRPDESVADWARRVWRAGTAPENDGTLRLSFEIYAAALRDPGAHRALLDRIVGRWMDALVPALERKGMDRERAASLATRLVAVNHGLVMDLLATGDHARVQAAYDAFMDELESELG